jgi:branched-chain amino acid transport system substrate-binding protein
MRAFLGMFLIAILALSGCSGPGAQTDTIKIGWLGALTGEDSLWGQSEYNTVKLVVDDLNLQGGLVVGGKTYRIGLASYDDHGDADAAVAAAKKLVSNDRVTVIIGPMFSREAIPVSRIIEAAGIPCIATSATNPKVTAADGHLNPFMFRACFIDSYQGEVAATYAYKRLGERTAAILVKSDDAYSIGLGEYFNENFRWLGGKVVASVSFKASDIDFRTELAKIKAAEPDIVFAPVFTNDIAMAAKQARAIGITAVMMGGDGWPSANLLPIAGSSLEGCYYVNHLDFDDPAVRDYKTWYKVTYGKTPEMPGYLAYDAVSMFVDAVKRAQSLDGTKIAQALESCDIKGITGHIKIGKMTHNPEAKEAAIIRITGDRMVFQERFAAATQ